MFEFRLRILDVRERDTDPPSFLGIVRRCMVPTDAKATGTTPAANLLNLEAPNVGTPFRWIGRA